ncbi:hypothetical protein OG21DRAFT_1413461, partial [Imleria badia]
LTSSQEQIENQSFENTGNRSLLVSCVTKRPVRVLRGADRDNHFAPLSGYRYDGLYIVDSAAMKKGMAGYGMCFFELTVSHHSIPTYVC